LSSNSTNWWSNIRIKSVFLFLLIFVSCENAKREIIDDEDTLAEVYGHVLTFSELEDKDFDWSKDSTLLWTLYVDQWIRDELFYIQAEEKLSDVSEIEKLVLSYRKSLMIHYFEQQLIQERLDSIISESEIVQHYEERMDNFVLGEKVLQAKWILTQSANFKTDSVNRYWNTGMGSKERLESLCELYSPSYNLNDSLWLSEKDLSNRTTIPIDQLSKLNEGVFHSLELEGNRKLMILINKIKETGSTAPISYVKERIRKIILHERKEQILKAYRQKIYQEAIQERKVKMYIR